MKFKFDIDDTILFSRIDESGRYHLKSWNALMIEKINKLYEQGHEIIIETGRHWNYLMMTQKQLEAIELKYHTLIMGKPPVDYSIDDKNLRPDEFLNMIII